MQLPTIGFIDAYLQGEDHAVRQPEVGKLLNLHSSQAHYQDEERERQRRIFTWMEQHGNGASQQASAQFTDRVSFRAQTCTRISPRKRRAGQPPTRSRINSKATRGSFLRQLPKTRPQGKMTRNSRLKGKGSKRRPRRVTASSTSSPEHNAGMST